MAPTAPITHLFAGIPTADYDRALPWYERLMGRPPDVVPNDHEAMWSATGTASIYLVANAGRAGAAVLTLAVDDLDRLLAELAERGVESGPVEMIGGAGRKAVVVDPEGNRIAFAEISAR